MNVHFRFDDTYVSNKFELYQNTPNPFYEQTLIGFNLPEASEATLSIYDASGRTLHVIEGDFEKGYNNVQVDRDVLNAPGILYYRLVTPTRHATKKMMYIKQ